MHHSSAPRCFSRYTERERLARDERLSAIGDADGCPTYGRAGDALAGDRSCGPDHRRNPERGQRATATGAADLEGASVFYKKKTAHHLWLRLPAECEASEITANLLRNGLAVIGSEAFTVNGRAPHAARVSLGAARNRAELTHALQILVRTLRQPASIRQIV